MQFDSTNSHSVVYVYVCVCVCIYCQGSNIPCWKEQRHFTPGGGNALTPEERRGSAGSIETYRLSCPIWQTLMKLFVMGFSAFSSGPVISGQASSVQQGWGQLITALLSLCLLGTDQMIWVDCGCDLKTRSIICKEHCCVIIDISVTLVLDQMNWWFLKYICTTSTVVVHSNDVRRL